MKQNLCFSPNASWLTAWRFSFFPMAMAALVVAPQSVRVAEAAESTYFYDCSSREVLSAIAGIAMAIDPVTFNNGQPATAWGTTTFKFGKAGGSSVGDGFASSTNFAVDLATLKPLGLSAPKSFTITRTLGGEAGTEVRACSFQNIWKHPDGWRLVKESYVKFPANSAAGTTMTIDVADQKDVATVYYFSVKGPKYGKFVSSIGPSSIPGTAPTQNSNDLCAQSSRITTAQKVASQGANLSVGVTPLPLAPTTVVKGKLGFTKSKSLTFGAVKPAGAAGPSMFTVAKTASGTAAVHVIVCSYEASSGTATPTVSVKKGTWIVFSRDLPTGTTRSFPATSPKDKTMVHLIYMLSESLFRSFEYSISQTW